MCIWQMKLNNMLKEREREQLAIGIQSRENLCASTCAKNPSRGYMPCEMTELARWKKGELRQVIYLFLLLFFSKVMYVMVSTYCWLSSVEKQMTPELGGFKHSFFLTSGNLGSTWKKQVFLLHSTSVGAAWSLGAGIIWRLLILAGVLARAIGWNTYKLPLHVAHASSQLVAGFQR